jgi:hypothetical protein
MLTALTVSNVLPDDPNGWPFAVLTLCRFVVAMFAGAGVLSFAGSLREAHRTGYLHGRAKMVLSLVEAEQRGMTRLDWLAAEMERDGIPLDVEHDEDGHVIAVRPPRSGG